MFCPDCGSPIAEGRAFCGKCGARLNAGASDPNHIDIAFSSVPTEPSKPPSPYRKLYLAVAAVLALFVGVAWWWFHRPAPPYEVKDPGIYPFVGKVDTENLWGFVNASGRLVTPPKWDGAAANVFVLEHPAPCNEGLCEVMEGSKWGYIDTTGNVVIQPQFERASPFVEGLARVYLGTQVGYIDRTGRYAINPQFSDAGDFHEGLAMVQSNDGWGIIDKGGSFVVKPKFYAVNPDGFSQGLAGVCEIGKCGYIGHGGKFVIRPQFEGVGTFSEGLAPVKVGGKTGYINSSGTIVINPQFDFGGMFSGGYASVIVSGHTATIDRQGKYILNPGQYNMEAREGNILPVGSKDGFGLIKKSGEWVLKPSSALLGVGAIYGGTFAGLLGPDKESAVISVSGNVLTGTYAGATLNALGPDTENVSKAKNDVQAIVNAETSYSTLYPQSGFTTDLKQLGSAGNATLDANHAGLIDDALASGKKDNYEFTLMRPDGNGGNTVYTLIAKPAAGHYGPVICANENRAISQAQTEQNCKVALVD